MNGTGTLKLDIDTANAIIIKNLVIVLLYSPIERK